MITLEEAKNFLRVDDEDDECLIASLVMTAKELTEEVLRKPIDELEPLPETIRQAMLILVGTLYESRQITKDKAGLDITETLNLVRLMLFAYREDKF